MKALLAPLALALSLIFSTGTATPAAAAQFTPAGLPLTLEGSIRIKPGLNTLDCRVIMNGAVNSSGVAFISSVSMTATSNLVCLSITANNLPWLITPTGPTQSSIATVAFVTPVGNCFGNSVSATWSGQLVNVFGGSSNCQITATLISTPQLTIVWP